MTDLCAKKLREIVFYDPDTGFCTRYKRRGAGKMIGTIDKHGHRKACIGYRIYAVHRLAWLYMTGEWPSGEIDHINGVRDDNRWCNLRDVTHAVNMQNVRLPRSHNKLGVLGVSRLGDEFTAAVKVGKKMFHYGPYKTVDEASAAYIAAKRILHEGCTL